MSTGTSACTANQSTRPTTAVFSRAFRPFHIAWVPKTRFRPATGSKWSGCGAIFRKWMPPCATAAASTATATSPSIGPRVAPREAIASWKTAFIVGIEGSATTRCTARSWCSPAAAAEPTADGMTSAATAMPIHAPRSCERPIWPFSWTSFIRFWVAFSDRSPLSDTPVTPVP